MRRSTITALVAVAGLLLAAGAGAASRWVITNTHQIKPSVLRQLHGNRGPRGFNGPTGRTGASGGVGREDTVISEKLTLQPGQTSYDVDPNNFQANCPTGESVIGTGFSADGATPYGVLSYTFFVGGFFANNISISTQVYLQAICAPVPYGMTANAVHRTTERAVYQSDLRAEASH